MTTKLPAPLNACKELNTLLALEHPGHAQEQFRLFVADYWLALAESPGGRWIPAPKSWTPEYTNVVTNVLIGYAHQVGHSLVLDRPQDKTLSQGSNGITAADLRQVGGDHYKKLQVQPWDAMEAWLTPEEFRGFLKGNIIKYLARANSDKEPHDVMIQKAAHYQQKLDEFLKKDSGNTN